MEGALSIGSDASTTTVPNTAVWPSYDATNGYGKDFVFDANVTSYAEDDTYRAEGIAFINAVQADQFKR